MPECFWPDDEEFVSYNCVYRLIKFPDRIIPQDFFPSHADEDGSLNSKKLASIKKPNKGNYSLSLNIELKNLDGLSLKLTFKGVAKGYTDLKRGISLSASASGHINYFLYDYINNNPSPDFIVV